MAYASIYSTRPTRAKHITPKMAEFIDYYMLHSSATKAVELSSYKTDNPTRMGLRLLAHPTIREEIKKRQDARSKKFEVTADFLVEKLAGIVARTEEDNPNAALRAIELLGKTIALWRDRQEITGADGEAIKHEQTIKENATDFTNKLTALAKRSSNQPGGVPGVASGVGTTNVVSITNARGTGTA